MVTGGMGEGSTGHCDLVLALPMMVLDGDGGCAIWLRLSEDDGGA